MRRWLSIVGWLILFSGRIDAKVVINEVMANPSDVGDASEWVEVYNDSDDAVDLTGWQLDDSDGGSTPYTINEVVLGAHQWWVIDKQTSHVELNNAQDSVRIYNVTHELIDIFEYKNATEEKVYARIPDGNDEWQQVERASPGATNVTTETTVIQISPSPQPVPLSGYLNEVYACPKETESEWVEVAVSGDPSAAENWYLVDKAGNIRSFAFDGSTTLIVVTLTSPILNNGGDTVRLLNATKNEVDATSYESCSGGLSWSKFDSGWRMTTMATAGDANLLVEPTATPQPTNTPTPTVKPTKFPSLTILADTGNNHNPRTTQSITSTFQEDGFTIASVAGTIDRRLKQTGSPVAQSMRLSQTTYGKGPMWLVIGGLCVVGAGFWPNLQKLVEQLRVDADNK